LTTVIEQDDTLAGWERTARVCSDGYVLVSWEQTVPRVNDEILDVTFYLYRTEAAARKGERAGGSGFLVHVPADPNISHTGVFMYAVSNAHVVKDFPVIRLNGTDGTFNIVPTKPLSWIPHQGGEDLAIYNLTLDPDIHRFRSIGQPLILGTLVPPDAMNIGLRDDVYMVGRFISLEGKQRNTCGSFRHNRNNAI
jgi:hypothetical protein